MKKKIFDVVFIVISAIILMVLSEYKLLEKYAVLSLIPVIIAYQFGKYVERKFKN